MCVPPLAAAEICVCCWQSDARDTLALLEALPAVSVQILMHAWWVLVTSIITANKRMRVEQTLTGVDVRRKTRRGRQGS